MKQGNEALLFSLQQATVLQARIILEELEDNPKQLLSFCRFARDIDASAAQKICHALATISARPSIELLVEYAQSADRNLSNEAFKALRRIDPHNTKKYILPLLDSSDTHICIAAINLLRHYGESFDKEYIRRLLARHSEEIITALLDSLADFRFSRNDEKRVGGLLVDCISHESINVRKKVLIVLRNVSLDVKEVKKLLLRFESESDQDVLAELCTALGYHTIEGAEAKIIEVLENKNYSLVVRTAAIGALSHYNTWDVAWALLMTLADTTTQKLHDACIRALSVLDEDMLVAVSATALRHGDIMVRIAGVELAGLLALPETEELLCTFWAQETAPEVIVEMIEVAGRAGFKTGWNLAKKELGGDPLLSYTAIQTLAAIVDKERIEEFAAILEEKHENSIYETVLSRLLSLGEEYSLPHNILPMIHAKINHPYINIQLLALKVAGCFTDTTITNEMFALLGTSQDEILLRTVSKSILKQFHSSVYEIVKKYPTRIAEIGTIIKYTPDIKIPSEFVVHIARLVVAGDTAANNVLVECGKRDLQALVRVLQTEPQDFTLAIIDAWYLADYSEQLQYPLPLKHLLRSPQRHIRKSVLLHAPRLIDHSIFSIILDASLYDEDLGVRKLAKYFIAMNFKHTQEDSCHEG